MKIYLHYFRFSFTCNWHHWDFLPLLPYHAFFLLLTLFFFHKGSKRLEQWF